MCGIYGTTLRYPLSVVQEKLETIRFRGPDYVGIKEYCVGLDKLVLGHVRLSIIDLEARSNQPFDYSPSVSIVFNGEIYNYNELKQRFFFDKSFRTKSDTEILCAMYEKFGVECIKYFDGMFSFVIFDHEKNILFGARDRLGKKPFYYYLSPLGIEFASQINAISRNNEFHIDSIARKQYLYLNYIADPNSIYEEVKKLEAGKYFVYNIGTKEFCVKKYWDIFDNSCRFKVPVSYDAAKAELHELLIDSIKVRLNADVPVGVFLSGGVDSSLVAALVAKINPNISSYTIGFHENGYDESIYAANVARYLGIPIQIDVCESQDVLAILKDYHKYFDEPFADNSLIPTSLVSQKARQHVAVALGGDGGDEFFWGYNWYIQQEKRKWQFSSIAMRKFLKYSSKIRQKYRVKSIMFDCDNIYEAYQFICKGNYYGAEQYDISDVVRSIPHSNLLSSSRGPLAYSDYDIKVFLNSDINTKTDRASMRSSLELRSPLMDYRILEYSRLLPFDYLYDKNFGQKKILKDILYQYVPKQYFERKKHGFSSPVGKWLLYNLVDEFTELVNKRNITELLPELNSDIIEQQKKLFLNGNLEYEQIMLKLYLYIKWYKLSKYKYTN